MNKILKVAVTGLGVSRIWLGQYVKAPETELALLHDIDEDRARNAAKNHGDIAWTTDFAEVLASDVDIVDISTPNHVHCEQAVAALAAGKHVLCQKPMAPSVDECRRMVAAAREHDRLLGMFMSNLAEPIFADLRRLVAEGCLGDIASARVRMGHRLLLRRENPANAWRADQAKIGGGSFMQLGIHYLNYVLALLDDEVESVQGISENRHCRRVTDGEDLTIAIARLKNSGVPLVIESGYSGDGKAVEIYGTGGFFSRHYQALVLELNRDFKGQVIDYRRPEETVPPGKNPPTVMEIPKGGPRDIQQRAFARAILEGRPAPVPGETGLKDVATAQAIYRAAAEKRIVKVAELLAGS